MTSDSQSGRSGQTAGSEKKAGSSSPCVRNCCLDDNDICLGCFRSLTEITGWSTTNGAQKEEILERCRQRQNERKRH